MVASEHLIKRAHAFVFDFDGVIVDSEPLKFQAYKNVFISRFGASLPEHDTSWQGKQERDVIQYWLQLLNIEGHIDQLVLEKRCEYYRILEEETPNPILGVLQILHTIHRHQFPIALATGSGLQETELILSRLKLQETFRTILTREHVRHSKPHPEIYTTAASKLKVSATNCVAFEDSPSGIAAAKAAGMKCIGVATTRGHDDLLEADNIINSFEDISVTSLVPNVHV